MNATLRWDLHFSHDGTYFIPGRLNSASVSLSSVDDELIDVDGPVSMLITSNLRRKEG